MLAKQAGGLCVELGARVFCSAGQASCQAREGGFAGLPGWQPQDEPGDGTSMAPVWAQHYSLSHWHGDLRTSAKPRGGCEACSQPSVPLRMRAPGPESQVPWPLGGWPGAWELPSLAFAAALAPSTTASCPAPRAPAAAAAGRCPPCLGGRLPTDLRGQIHMVPLPPPARWVRLPLEN